jgi:hypothetical protein
MPSMGIRIFVELDGLTFGDLYRFVDHARSAGLQDDMPVSVETTDGIGNEVGAHTLAGELGAVNDLTRPAMIDRSDVHRYAEALRKEISQESDLADAEVLKELLRDLWRAEDS